MSVLALGGMKRALVLVVALVSSLGGVGCGGDDDDDSGAGGSSGAGTSSAGTNSSGGTGSSGSARCHDGCVLVLEADCPISPDSQESCEADCSDNETGACATEYDAFQDCAEGETITCSTIGIPAVEACMDEQTAFISCLM